MLQLQARSFPVDGPGGQPIGPLTPIYSTVLAHESTVPKGNKLDGK